MSINAFGMKNAFQVVGTFLMRNHFTPTFIFINKNLKYSTNMLHLSDNYSFRNDKVHTTDAQTKFIITSVLLIIGNIDHLIKFIDERNKNKFSLAIL